MEGEPNKREGSEILEMGGGVGVTNNFWGSKYAQKLHVFTKISLFEISNPKN